MPHKDSQLPLPGMSQNRSRNLLSSWISDWNWASICELSVETHSDLGWTLCEAQDNSSISMEHRFLCSACYSPQIQPWEAPGWGQLNGRLPLVSFHQVSSVSIWCNADRSTSTCCRSLATNPQHTSGAHKSIITPRSADSPMLQQAVALFITSLNKLIMRAPVRLRSREKLWSSRPMFRFHGTSGSIYPCIVKGS